MALSNDEILEAIANMTVQQAADLVKAMEEKFGVSAAAPVAVAAAPGAAGGAAEEQTEFTVSLDKVAADKKIAVIKAVRTITGLGLAEGKHPDRVYTCGINVVHLESSFSGDHSW